MACNDNALGILIELEMQALVNEQPLFPDVLVAPIFYQRYIKKWIKEGIEIARKAKEAADSTPKATDIAKT